VEKGSAILIGTYLEQRAWEAACIQYETVVGQYPEDALAQEWLGICPDRQRRLNCITSPGCTVIDNGT